MSGTKPESGEEEVALGNSSEYVEVYTYDLLNRMVGMNQGDTTASYTYDGTGMRQSKTVNGVTTNFLLDGMYVVQETTGDSSTYYSRGLSLISRTANDATDYYFTNHHGDVTKLVSSTGTVIADYTYDAFGNEVNPASDSNPFRYCGEYFDAETGNLYLRARYYDMATGRFTQEDPARDGLNWYVYCAGNPVNRIDLNGLDSYVIYDPTQFGSQLESEIMRLKENFGTPVHVIAVTTVDEFIAAWNSLGSNGRSIDGVTLSFHGSKDTINISAANGQYITSKQNGKTPKGSDATYIGDKGIFQDKNIKKLYLQICSAGHLDSRATNIASKFANLYSIDQVIAWDGDTGYDRYLYFDEDGRPQAYYHPRLANNQGSFYSSSNGRAPTGRVIYTKWGVTTLGEPEMIWYIAGRQIYTGPR